jgi:Spy/CpxP family protein refolding chaperone
MMRKTTAKLLAFALLLNATAALAQGPRGHGPGGPRGNRIDFLATVLSLTDAQKTQATAIFDAAETASASLRETQASQRMALNDAAKSNAADAAIDQLAATLGATSGQLAAIQTKAFAKFYALLTTDQRTKLDEVKANGRGMRGPGADLSVGPGLP